MTRTPMCGSECRAGRGMVPAQLRTALLPCRGGRRPSSLFDDPEQHERREPDDARQRRQLLHGEAMDLVGGGSVHLDAQIVAAGRDRHVADLGELGHALGDLMQPPRLDLGDDVGRGRISHLLSIEANRKVEHPGGTHLLDAEPDGSRRHVERPRDLLAADRGVTAEDLDDLPVDLVDGVHALPLSIRCPGVSMPKWNSYCKNTSASGSTYYGHFPFRP